MNKFEVGDRIRVIENGNLGTITNIIVKDYSVCWDHGYVGVCHYSMDEVEHIWEKEKVYSFDFLYLLKPISTIKVDLSEISGLENKLEYKKDKLPIECEHDWAHYQGMFEVYEYCKKCDKKKNS